MIFWKSKHFAYASWEKLVTVVDVAVAAHATAFYLL